MAISAKPDDRQEKPARMRLHPVDQCRGPIHPAWSPDRQYVGIDQVQESFLECSVPCRAHVTRRQVTVLQWCREQQPAKGRYLAETIPLIDPKDDGPRFAVASDDRRLSMGRVLPALRVWPLRRVIEPRA